MRQASIESVNRLLHCKSPRVTRTVWPEALASSRLSTSLEGHFETCPDVDRLKENR